MIGSTVPLAIESLADEGTESGIVDRDGIIIDPTPLEQITALQLGLADFLFVLLPAAMELIKTPSTGINQ